MILEFVLTNRLFIGICILASAFWLTGCSAPVGTYGWNKKQPFITSQDRHKTTMRNYNVFGKTYNPTYIETGETMSGIASWYGPDFHGKLTSNGETYNMYDMTAAHKTLPMNTIVKVTNLENGLKTVVRINDRGPFVGTRIIDLSNTAAKEIGMLNAGTASVKVEVLGYYNSNLNDANDIGSPINKNKKIDVAAPTIDPRPVEKKELPEASYALQIASFSKIESAIKTQEAYKDTNGYRAEIKDMENENGRIFKVWIKGFKSAQEVQEYRDLGYFKNAFIVRED